MQCVSLLRKLTYQSLHRGCKENDIILERYARSKLQNASLETLIIYESFLSEADVDIYAWIAGTMLAPSSYHEIVSDIRLCL